MNLKVTLSTRLSFCSGTYFASEPGITFKRRCSAMRSNLLRFVLAMFLASSYSSNAYADESLAADPCCKATWNLFQARERARLICSSLGQTSLACMVALSELDDAEEKRSNECSFLYSKAILGIICAKALVALYQD